MPAKVPQPSRIDLIGQNGNDGLHYDDHLTETFHPIGKETNPKDAIGSRKLPLDLVPMTALAHQSLAHLDGACKYGKWNWREAGVRTSVYIAAVERHVRRFMEGQDYDPDSGVHNLGHAMACLAILLDAQEVGKLNDDRPPAFVNIAEFQESMNDGAARIIDRYAV